jgi:rod shape-determining protein MreC
MNILQRTYLFFVNFRDYIVFTALAVMSFSMISLGDFTSIGGLRATVVTVVGYINEHILIIPNITAMRQENQVLRELNMDLSTEVTQNFLAEKENSQLRKLLDLPKKIGRPIVFADVVGIEKIGNRTYMIINKGNKSGIDFGMTVRTDAGLIGSIAATSGSYAIVETIFNPDVKISVSVANSSLKGIVTWDGKTDLLLDNIPKTIPVKKNEEVVTSNFSSRYPPDIPIGYIRTVEIPKSSLFWRIVIQPYAMYNQVQQVAVVKEIQDSVKVKLIKQYFEIKLK